MDWEECKKKHLAKEVNIDKHLINSLIKSSSKKIYSQKSLELNEMTASSKISLVYDALRELLEALAISKSHKIYNHECYCSFLKEILNKSELGDEFDKFRRIRNAINYYGKDISANESKLLINQMLLFIEKIKNLIKNE